MGRSLFATRFFELLVLVGLTARCFASPPEAPPNLEKAGKLVIAGGAINSAHSEVWDVMLAGRLQGRPIGIISTASDVPAETGIPFATKINTERGQGSAVFLPLSMDNGPSASGETLALIRGCGGFYFTGGKQDKTVRILKTTKGAPTAALAAIWEVYLQGGIIGGSSAGAAIMSDPMITGGSSAEALRHGATPTEAAAEKRGVGYGPGIGFHPGVLYCQHHLERGRFGRLLAALVSDAFHARIGIGIAEDTAWVVDHAKQTGTVIGAKGALFVDASKAVKRADGNISRVRLHYLDRHDTIHLQTGVITPAQGKTEYAASSQPRASAEATDAWSKDAIWHLLQDLASSGGSAHSPAVARDARFELQLRRDNLTRVWRMPSEAKNERPTFTVSHVAVTVAPRTASPKAADLPVGKSRFLLSARGKSLEVFTYRPTNYQDGPLFVVMHGLNRNAEDYRDNAIALGDRFQALIVAPALSLEQFPSEAYQRGGITRDGKAQAMEQWTFQFISDVVSSVRSRMGREQLPYYLIGHSAGGQFLNRLAAFLPGEAVRIVATNPGTLIFPDRQFSFPFGFDGLPKKWSDDAWIKSYLAAPLTLYLGTADTEAGNLDVTPEAMRQGGTRIERGRACYERGAALARERGWPFGWTLVEVEGIGHSSAQMFAHPRAQEALFGR
jgi:cyanophycinase